MIVIPESETHKPAEAATTAAAVTEVLRSVCGFDLFEPVVLFLFMILNNSETLLHHTPLRLCPLQILR
jgi:hypothetical protein